MAYFIRYRKTNEQVEWSRGCLVELKSYKDTLESADWFFERISGSEAHRWVRNDGHHETPLWIDQGRIRYARDAGD